MKCSDPCLFHNDLVFTTSCLQVELKRCPFLLSNVEKVAWYSSVEIKSQKYECLNNVFSYAFIGAVIRGINKNKNKKMMKMKMNPLSLCLPLVAMSKICQALFI